MLQSKWIMRSLVILLFVLSASALVLGVMLFKQRETLKGRTQKLEAAAKQVAATLEEQIKGDKTIKESEWIRSLRTRLADVFDETFRRLGGVRKFYEVKGQARPEMARHIARRRGLR